MRSGDRVGKYVLEGRIALGGMAEVWAARVEGPERFTKAVAIKFILPTYSQDREYEKLFLNEARLAAELQHRNLVSILDFDRIPDSASSDIAGRLYLVMERVDGRDLSKVLQSCAAARQPPSQMLVAHIAIEMLEGLRYIHGIQPGAGRALVHRDISPQNVLISYSGEVKLSDFGIAKLTSSRPTDDGRVRGKLGYFAPERLRGEQATPQADQFAAGIVLWEMLAGRQLFFGNNEAQVLEGIRRCEIPKLGTPDYPVSPELERAVRKMLSPEPTDRFSDVGVAIEAIHDAVPLKGGMALKLGEMMNRLYPPQTRRRVEAVQPEATAIIPELAQAPIHGEAPSFSAEPPRLAPTTPLSAAAASAPPPVVQAMLSNAAPAVVPTRVLAVIPRRRTEVTYVAGFTAARQADLFEQTMLRFEAAKASGGFDGAFDDWIEKHAQRGQDAISGRPLPQDWALVAKWPRFTDVGWERPLSFNWCGSIPWGDDGFWVAEDAVTDEMMVVFSRDLDRSPFTGITTGQWRSWWQQREVDIMTELPGNSRLPMSNLARRVLGPSASPPATKREWMKLMTSMEAGGDIMARLRASGPPAVNTARPSLWKKIVGVAFGKKDPPQ